MTPADLRNLRASLFLAPADAGRLMVPPVPRDTVEKWEKHWRPDPAYVQTLQAIDDAIEDAITSEIRNAVEEPDPIVLIRHRSDATFSIVERVTGRLDRFRLRSCHNAFICRLEREHRLMGRVVHIVDYDHDSFAAWQAETGPTSTKREQYREWARYELARFIREAA